MFVLTCRSVGSSTSFLLCNMHIYTNQTNNIVVCSNRDARVFDLHSSPTLFWICLQHPYRCIHIIYVFVYTYFCHFTFDLILGSHRSNFPRLIMTSRGVEMAFEDFSLGPLYAYIKGNPLDERGIPLAKECSFIAFIDSFIPPSYSKGLLLPETSMVGR